MITLESLKQMFANIATKTHWDIQGDLLWGYFFTDHDPNKFGPLTKHLEKLGYCYVGILEPDEADEDSVYFFHVERLEHHTPHSLNERNREFSRLAEQFGVETYDGMDVGPVSK